MNLPNADHAVVDVRKLRDYVLNTEHQRGRHKARVFASTFGIKVDDAEAFRGYLLQAAKLQDVIVGDVGDYGTQYRMDIKFTWNEKSDDIRITWFVRIDEDFPRLVSCFVRLKRRQT